METSIYLNTTRIRSIWQEGQGSGESATSALEYIDQCEAQNTPYVARPL